MFTLTPLLGRGVWNRNRFFYKNVDYEEFRDPLFLDTKQIRLNKKVKTTSEALQGLWLHDNGSEIKFVIYFP